nr:helix-turn-helix transcriptional regulator [uncultured Arsenicibacter sp.]
MSDQIASPVGEINNSTKSIPAQNAEKGKRLRAIRIAKGVSQAEMAKLLKKQKSGGQSYISQLELGKHGLSNNHRAIYILQLGVNPSYIDHGIGEMFLDPADRIATADQIYLALQQESKGNMRYVRPDSLANFMREPLSANSFNFPLSSESMIWLPVLTYDGSRDYPFGSYVVCLVGNESSLLKGRLFVFQTDEDLLLCRYNNTADGLHSLQLLNGENMTLPTDSVKGIYIVQNRYVPAV